MNYHPTQPGGPQYGPPVQPGPAAPEPNGKRTVRLGWVIGIAAGCLLLGITIGAAGSGGDDGGESASPATTVTVTATPEPAAKADEKATPAAEPTTAKPKPKPKPAGPPREFGDGTYEVGKDVAAGTYRTAGPSDSDFPSCYWARTEDASGEFEAIIANGNPSGPASLTIQAGEYVESSGCETWKKVG